MIKFIQFLLLPVSVLYCYIARLRRLLYDLDLLSSEHLPGYTISVGNLEVGGTGKSPICIELARYLIEAGHTPAILTRGYGSGLRRDDSAVLLNEQLILPPTHSETFFADEARMQSHHLPSVPIVIGANRLAAAKRYLANHPAPTHWILEDGFQHRKIKRDVEIVLLDYHKPFDNGLCLPSGRLRESIATIKCADLVILTRAPTEDAALPKQIASVLKPDTSVDWARFESSTPYSPAFGQTQTFDPKCPTALLLGIAKPGPLHQQLKEESINISETYILRDHQPITAEELQSLASRCQQILTTEKDYFRNESAFTESLNKVYLIPLKVTFKRGFHKFFNEIIENT